MANGSKVPQRHTHTTEWGGEPHVGVCHDLFYMYVSGGCTHVHTVFCMCLCADRYKCTESQHQVSFLRYHMPCIFIFIFKILLLHLFICLFIGAYRHTSATVSVWSSENNLRGSLFPFRDMGPRMNSGQEQELSHLASPHLVIQYKVSHGLVLTGLAGNPGDSPVSTSLVLTLIQSMCHHTQILVCRSGESNFCLHVCTMNLWNHELR